MHIQRALKTALLFLLSFVLISCGGSNSLTITSQPPRITGSVFVVGTDAPLASVLAFKVTFTGLTVSDGTSTTSLLPQPQDIEFARLNGLRSLLSLQSVPAGTYTSVTATLATPVISFLDTSTNPPSVQTLNGTLTQSSITIMLSQPLIVTDGGLIGIHLDFRLRDSIELDPAGQVTGRVAPHIVMRIIPPDAPDAEIDELRGGVVSVDVANNSFVVQGPHGRNITVTTDAQTQFEPGEGLSTLNTDTIVEVSGSLQRASLTLRATEVEVLSRTRFLLGGLITDVRPASGPANQVDLLVRTEIPDLPNAQVGGIATVPLDGNEVFMIHHLRLPITGLLFNNSSLIRGQRVAIGGDLSGPAPDARRVVLSRQGLEGGWVPGSTNITNGNNGTFSFNVAGVTGILFGGPVQVLTSDRTRFINLSGLSGLTGATPIRIRVVGLVLKNPASGNTTIVAWAVERLQ